MDDFLQHQPLTGCLPAALWAAAEPLLAPAAAVSMTHDTADIADAINEGLMQLWLSPGLAVVTEIALFPKMRVLNICFVGGTVFDAVGGFASDAAGMLAAIESYARGLGCRRLYGGGRAGWGPALRRHGWLAMPEIYKDLSP